MTASSDLPMALGCADLHVWYGGGHAVRGISLQVNRGERIAVIGESGCGKTTLVRTVLGLLPGSARVSGSICLDGAVELVGASATVLRAVRGARIGYVPQNPARSFDPLRSVGSQLAEAWRCHGQRVSPAYLAGLLEQFGVQDAARLMTRRPAAWSGGMLQRAAILAATALRPGLVLADEPTSSLDRPLARQMLATLAANCETLLVVTHDIDLIAGLVDRVVVLYAGLIVEDAPADRFLATPRHPYGRALLGAIPRPGRLPEELPGDPPRSTETISGCPFAPRCAERAAICDTPPPVIDGAACHFVAGTRT